MRARAACFSLATKETQVMQFQKGQSGNPAGRPRGSRNKTTVLLQNLLEGEAEEIARKAIEMAKAGDIGAIRVCMDRLASIRRKDPVAFELPPVDKASDSVKALAAVVAAVAAGDVTTSEPPRWPRSSMPTCARSRRRRSRNGWSGSNAGRISPCRHRSRRCTAIMPLQRPTPDAFGFLCSFPVMVLFFRLTVS